MNSGDGRVLGEPSEGGEEMPAADGNANVDQSKGAIPKTHRALRPNNSAASTKKASVKLNNNLEETRNLNGGKRYYESLGRYYIRTEVGCASDSDSEQDDAESLSVSDDGCIYTYKGDNAADLPESFFSLEVAEVVAVSDANRNSSPEMDFLEMDFDPAVDSDAASSSEETARLHTETEPETPKSPQLQCRTKLPETNQRLSSPFDSLLRRQKQKHEELVARRNHSHQSLRYPSKPRRVMLWSETEASEQHRNVPCGLTTAVLDVFRALRYPEPSSERIREALPVRRVDPCASLTDYLLSCSVSGSSHDDVIAAVKRMSDGQLHGRFFPMYPSRRVDLHGWLAFWMENGAVPVVSLDDPSVRHRTVYGVADEGLYLTNPSECVRWERIVQRLTTEPVTTVRRDQVLGRWSPVEMRRLMYVRDVRWRRTNVVGQVANLVRENGCEAGKTTETSHVKVPAGYECGVTLVTDVGSAAFPLLVRAPELERRTTTDGASAFPGG